MIGGEAERLHERQGGDKDLRKEILQLWKVCRGRQRWRHKYVVGVNYDVTSWKILQVHDGNQLIWQIASDKSSLRSILALDLVRDRFVEVKASLQLG